MDEIRLDIKLRPIRFLFLVKPNDKKNLEKVFQINTLLWGGKYNPIVPYFKRVPKWWGSDHKTYNATKILNDYLDFFEPDFIVETEESMTKDFVFDKERVLQVDDLLSVDEHGLDDKYGLTVYDLYVDLYEKKYQFERRHKVNIVNVISENKKNQLFTSCIFGSFSKSPELCFFEEGFIDVFDPKKVELNDISLIELYQGSNLSPLDATHADIDIQYHQSSPDARLFIFDLEAPRDLIDYWNLRIIYKNIVAIPMQWIAKLADFCNEFISDNYRARPHQEEYFFRTTIMFSRSISEDKGSEIYNKYLSGNENKTILQFWYPDIRVDKSDNPMELQRSILIFEQVNRDIALTYEYEKPQIQFDTIAPDFIKKKYHHKPLWANVINIKDWGNQSRTLTCFPTNYRNPVFPKFNYHRDFLLPTTEGLTIFPESINRQYWNLHNGTEAINQWLSKYEIKATVSDAGKSVQQIIETIGGVPQLSSLANKNIVERLNDMTNKPLTRSMHAEEFKNRINTKNNKKPASRLVSQKIVQLGLELKCSKCDSWNWYEINNLNYELSCNRCLKFFNFPILDPSNSSLSRWSYRVVGAFALPDYARGGYAASLAIHFFVRKVSYSHMLNITWSSGQELTLQSGEKAEADFILWAQREKIVGLNKPTNIVFGEAKSFAKDAFKDSDIQKMKLLAETFPKSILVFATMKSFDEFSVDEVQRLRKLADWGRGYDNKNKEVRAYVMILTGLELFMGGLERLTNVWEDEGGKYAELAKKRRIHSDNLETLAYATQELYLNMPSYYEGLYNIKL
ncbi:MULTISPECIES: hypothetical protein [Psychrobacter]|uniref:Uncharacterized protein n=1 Tax=Psychrobacter alimentarius TaxID=261164 RepID=A0ABM6A112_9GAMM|nr:MULTISPECIES: hypothetical protein [Psychrobacter]AMT98063.1 hypothetical protein A3K91_2491 [Psychrobacter alimentarius]QCB29667.1 hypothetical protein E5677_00970 [Psychrobacter sp. PAMC27889]